MSIKTWRILLLVIRRCLPIDAKTFVASAKAEPYEVLPQEAGLSQLVKSGVLTRNENGEFLIDERRGFRPA